MQKDGLLPLNPHALQVIGDVAYHDYEGSARSPEERARFLADLGDRPPIGDGRAPPLSFRITDHRAGRLLATPLRLWNQTWTARLSDEVRRDRG